MRCREVVQAHEEKLREEAAQRAAEIRQRWKRETARLKQELRATRAMHVQDEDLKQQVEAKQDSKLREHEKGKLQHQTEVARMHGRRKSAYTSPALQAVAGKSPGARKGKVSFKAVAGKRAFAPAGDGPR